MHAYVWTSERTWTHPGCGMACRENRAGREGDPMTLTRRHGIGSDLRRMGRKVASAFQYDAGGPVGEGNGPGVSQRRRAGVPPLIAIGDVMERDLATVLPESSVRNAVALMIEHGISSIPVVDGLGRIAGALNEGDLMQVFYDPGVRCVADVMTQEPIVLSVNAPFVDVIDQLMSSSFRRVLIDDNGLLVGVITRSHVMPALLEALELQTRVETSH